MLFENQDLEPKWLRETPVSDSKTSSIQFSHEQITCFEVNDYFSLKVLLSTRAEFKLLSNKTIFGPSRIVFGPLWMAFTLFFVFLHHRCRRRRHRRRCRLVVVIVDTDDVAIVVVVVVDVIAIGWSPLPRGETCGFTMTAITNEL